jgi:hypothetical protein
LYQDVNAWVKQETGQDLDDSSLDYWRIYDDEGEVNPKQQRTLTEEDRIAIIAQRIQSTINEREDCGLQNQTVTRFLQGTKWRKHRVRIKREEEEIDPKTSEEKG